MPLSAASTQANSDPLFPLEVGWESQWPVTPILNYTLLLRKKLTPISRPRFHLWDLSIRAPACRLERRNVPWVTSYHTLAGSVDPPPVPHRVHLSEQKDGRQQWACPLSLICVPAEHCQHGNRVPHFIYSLK